MNSRADPNHFSMSNTKKLNAIMNNKKITIVAALSAMLLSGCSSTGLFLLNSTLKLKSNNNVAKNVSFGDQEWQTLDVYSPSTEPSKDKKPVLIFFYGGSWDSGNKEMYYFVADAFVRRGYVVVIPDYIKYPEARFPMFVEDGAAAIAWTKTNITQHGGDPNNVFVAGHSAGAHLGGMLATDSQYLEKHGLTPLDIKGFSGLAGPYNFTPTRASLIEVFGPEENYPKMQAMHFVDGDEPPMLLLHGGKDETVGVMNQEILLEKLNAVGNQSKGILYPNLDHISILMSITPWLQGDSTTVEDMDMFFKNLSHQKLANLNHKSVKPN